MAASGACGPRTSTSRVKVGKPGARRRALKNNTGHVASECPLAGRAPGAGDGDAPRARPPKPFRADHPIEMFARAYGLTEYTPMTAAQDRALRTSCRSPSTATLRAERRKRMSEIKKHRRLEVGPVRDLLLRELRHHAAPGARDAVHREGRRRADPRRARRLQSADPAGQRAGGDGDVRDRRPGPPRARAGAGWAASRTRPSSASAARRCAASPRTTSSARARTARPPRCSSCAFPSRAAQVAAFRSGAGDVIVGFDHAELRPHGGDAAGRAPGAGQGLRLNAWRRSAG